MPSGSAATGILRHLGASAVADESSGIAAADACAAERRAFWASVHESAMAMAVAPDWKTAGITLNPRNFITYGPEDE